MNIRKAISLVTALLLASTASQAQQAPATIEELWEIVQRQQAQIDELRFELGEARAAMAATNERVEETEVRVEATGDYVETLAAADSGAQKTTIGGYGELHYNNTKSDAGDSDEIDVHRFVLFFGHEFSDRVRFFSEFELEHSLAGDGAPGEVELEQAYVEYALTENTFAKAGMVDYSGPVLRLASLTPEDFYVLLHKLRHVYASGDAAKYLVPDEAIPTFMEHCAKRLGGSCLGCHSYTSSRPGSSSWPTRRRRSSSARSSPGR